MSGPAPSPRTRTRTESALHALDAFGDCRWSATPCRRSNLEAMGDLDRGCALGLWSDQLTNASLNPGSSRHAADRQRLEPIGSWSRRQAWRTLRVRSSTEAS